MSDERCDRDRVTPDSTALAEAARRLRPELAAKLKTLAWLDEDGQHVNVVHYCVDRNRMVFMLPWPNWQAVDGSVKPSMECGACGFHDFLMIAGGSDV